MSKDFCSEISAHFGIDSVENSVANRRSVITFDRLGRCFRFVYVYARVLLCLFVLLPFLGEQRFRYWTISARRRLCVLMSRYSDHLFCVAIAPSRVKGSPVSAKLRLPALLSEEDRLHSAQGAWVPRLSTVLAVLPAASSAAVILATNPSLTWTLRPQDRRRKSTWVNRI